MSGFRRHMFEVGLMSELDIFNSKLKIVKLHYLLC